MSFRKVTRIYRNDSNPYLHQTHLARITDPRLFEGSADGGGIFGRWILDSAGLPAYSYELDQYANPYARTVTSQGFERRTHWYQIGNDRVTGLVSNDGIVQLYSADRGSVIFNYVDAFEKAGTLLGFLSLALRRLLRISEGCTPSYGGGFGYMAEVDDKDDDHTHVWATAYRYAPKGSVKTRLFGMGYHETQTDYRGICVTRHVYAPPGNEPVLLTDVKIKNTTQTRRTLRYYEYWDVNIHQLSLQWFRTGLFGAIGDELRRRINRRFTPSIDWQPVAQSLRFHQQLIATDFENCAIDHTPDNVFLAALKGTPSAHYVNKSTFFGQGGVFRPDAVSAGPQQQDAHASKNTASMPYCMVLCHDLVLEPGQSVTLRYAYGTVKPGDSLEFLQKYRSETGLQDIQNHWRKSVAHFKMANEPVVQREIAWHSYNLLSSTLHDAHYDTYHTPQGSAYLFSHGADGAPRDKALFVLALTYLCPNLARENLRLLTRLMDESGRLPYAFFGHGLQSDGHGIHATPSDLGLFFMMALAEYIMATGHNGFLQEQVAEKRTVADCVRAAFDYLITQTRIGPSGLICIGDGDWDDTSVLPAPLLNPQVDYWKSKHHGESIPNTGMALYLLPRIAVVMEACDPELSQQMRSLEQKLRKSLQAQWNGRWFNRSVLRDWFDNPVYIGKDDIHLQAQVWALISGIAKDMGVETQLVNEIKTQLDDPSPTGAMQDQNGRIWSAISQLLTWGYTRSRPDLAWRSLKRQMFANHAHVFPERWFNIWSGPDAVDSRHTSTPGHTWISPVTPMADFPVMNANPDAMALLALLRVCGIEPTSDGLIIAPHLECFVLDLALLRLDVAPGRIVVEYRPIVNGERTFHLRVPARTSGFHVWIDGCPTEAFKHVGNEVALSVLFQKDIPITFAVHWKIGTGKVESFLRKQEQAVR